MDGITKAVSVAAAAAADTSDDGTQCSNHPNAAADGGICALCLQDKLGKLVKSSSTSFSIASSTSPSFRSDPSSTVADAGLFATNTSVAASASSNGQFQQSTAIMPAEPAHNCSRAQEKKEKATAERGRGGFWSFLNHLKKSSPKTASSATPRHKQNGVVPEVVPNPNGAAPTTSFGRKAISRSRSVGCGSVSFSGDFFEKISTGFGGCSTLRRVESQREGKRSSVQSGAGDVIKERVRCGGIFSGFMMTSSSSSSSSSFRLSCSTASEEVSAEATQTAAAAQGRSRGRGWPFASPMRVFGKHSSTAASKGKPKPGPGPRPTPNFAAIPSLMTARG